MTKLAANVINKIHQ